VSVFLPAINGTNIRGNTDGQNETTWGALSAYNVPYIVVPNSFVESRKIPENALSVVICDGQMFYAILGDTNGDTPQVIGEASILMGETCFPSANVSGAVGHSSVDVLCTSPTTILLITDIVFNIEFTGVNSTYITDFNGLKQLGDQKMAELVTSLSSGSGTPGSGNESSGEKSSGSTTQSSSLLVLLTLVSLVAYFYI
jgi:chitosanase